MSPTDTVTTSLREQGPATVADLCERTGYDPRSVFRAITDARRAGVPVVAQQVLGEPTIFVVDDASEAVRE